MRRHCLSIDSWFVIHAGGFLSQGLISWGFRETNPWVIDDPLVDAAQCALDATLMKTLGANSIRVYHVDPTADHSGCMKEFDNAGIYTLIDLDTFSSYILPVGPLPFFAPPSSTEKRRGYPCYWYRYHCVYLVFANL